jgi:hypothetical protein
MSDEIFKHPAARATQHLARCRCPRGDASTLPRLTRGRSSRRLLARCRRRRARRRPCIVVWQLSFVRDTAATREARCTAVAAGARVRGACRAAAPRCGAFRSVSPVVARRWRAHTCAWRSRMTPTAPTARHVAAPPLRARRGRRTWSWAGCRPWASAAASATGARGAQRGYAFFRAFVAGRMHGSSQCLLLTRCRTACVRAAAFRRARSCGSRARAGTRG